VFLAPLTPPKREEGMYHTYFTLNNFSLFTVSSCTFTCNVDSYAVPSQKETYLQVAIELFPQNN
jgi:hypothetical protein